MALLLQGPAPWSIVGSPPVRLEGRTPGLGQLPVLITSTTVPDLEIKPADQILRVMRQLWPYRAGFLWPPGAILTDNDAETLTASFDRTISSPGFEWVARP
jgi:hypothetical protein